MATKKGKKAAQQYDWKKDWYLHSPEDWVMLIVAMLGFANLMPNISFGQPFDFAWPVIITAIFLYKFGKRNQME
ncbi:MAG: hypothetical protein WC588_05560 [Candidatus Micrarchaeia archaeon]